VLPRWFQGLWQGGQAQGGCVWANRAKRGRGENHPCLELCTDGNAMSLLEECDVADEVSEEQLRCRFEKEVEKFKVASWVIGLGNWDVFMTGTFKGETSSVEANRRFLWWMNRMLPGHRVLYVVENHPGGHGAHLHGLLATKGCYRKRLWADWYERFGRCRFDPVRSKNEAARYTMKMVLGYEMTKQWRKGVFWDVLNCGVEKPEDLVLI